MPGVAYPRVQEPDRWVRIFWDFGIDRGDVDRGLESICGCGPVDYTHGGGTAVEGGSGIEGGIEGGIRRFKITAGYMRSPATVTHPARTASGRFGPFSAGTN